MPSKSDLSPPDVKAFRAELERALNVTDDEGRKWGDAQWGVYAFYDYEGEPIYVGQTNERLRTRVRRHLTNQRTDAVAMRVLDVMEVAEIALYPLWEYQGRSASKGSPGSAQRKEHLNALEFSVYHDAISQSRYGAILNEKLPPRSATVPLPEHYRHRLVDAELFDVQHHPDVRLARRAETISRLADVVRERGEVSQGLRRVLLVQAIRLTHLAAQRLAETEGREPPPATAIDTTILIDSDGLTGSDSQDDQLDLDV